MLFFSCDRLRKRAFACSIALGEMSMPRTSRPRSSKAIPTTPVPQPTSRAGPRGGKSVRSVSSAGWMCPMSHDGLVVYAKSIEALESIDRTIRRILRSYRNATHELRRTQHDTSGATRSQISDHPVLTMHCTPAIVRQSHASYPRNAKKPGLGPGFDCVERGDRTYAVAGIRSTPV